MVMNTAAVRMSVPIVPAQTVKQVTSLFSQFWIYYEHKQ